MAAGLQPGAPAGRWNGGLCLYRNPQRERCCCDITELTTIDYPRHLRMEKEIMSVANVTKRDVENCLALFAQHPGILPHTQCYSFDDANAALTDLVAGDSVGARVIAIPGTIA